VLLEAGMLLAADAPTAVSMLLMVGKLCESATEGFRS
jgi:hypothetical protein